MKANWKILLEKSREAMLAAVTIYNNPLVTFKSELFIVNAEIAWTYLFHSYYAKNKINYYYRKQNKYGRFVYEKIDGRKKEWELSQCIKVEQSPIDLPTAKNLELLIRVRNAIEHSYYPMNDDLISSKIQACSLNFNYFIKNIFGTKYGLDKSLSISIQFSALNPEQRKLQTSLKTQDNISKMIASYEKTLPLDLKEDLHYAYRVLFVETNVNRENQADQTIKFIKNGSEESNAIKIAIKETEKPKFLPNEVVKLIKDAGFKSFTISKHTDLWKKLNAKNKEYHFGVSISGKWYWYQSWINHAIAYLRERELNNI